jgi:hypothetical protein
MGLNMSDIEILKLIMDNKPEPVCYHSYNLIHDCKKYHVLYCDKCNHYNIGWFK